MFPDHAVLWGRKIHRHIIYVKTNQEETLTIVGAREKEGHSKMSLHFLQ